MCCGLVECRFHDGQDWMQKREKQGKTEYLNPATRSSGGSAMLSEAWFGPTLQRTEKPALTVSVGKRKNTLKNVPYDGF